MHLSLKLHGPFHALSQEAHYLVSLHTQAPTLADFINALEKDLRKKQPHLVQLLPACRFAQHQNVIDDHNKKLDIHAQIVVLPPVSGG